MKTKAPQPKIKLWVLSALYGRGDTEMEETIIEVSALTPYDIMTAIDPDIKDDCTRADFKEGVGVAFPLKKNKGIYFELIDMGTYTCVVIP